MVWQMLKASGSPHCTKWHEILTFRWFLFQYLFS